MLRVALVGFFRGFVVFVFARVVWVSGFMFFPLRVLLGVVLGVMVFWAGSAVAGASAAVLPDGRVYELVSVSGSGEPYLPPTPLGERKEATGFRTGLPFRAGAVGDAVTYAAEPGATTGTGETGPQEGNQWFASRTSNGWQTEDITPPENNTAIYEAFSSDLKTAFYEGDTKPLTGEVEQGCASLYKRARIDGSFRALFNGGTAPGNCGHPLFAGASMDESQVIFQSEAALTPGSEEATGADLPPGRLEHRTIPNIGEGCEFGCNLYESVGGVLRSVNVLGGEPVPSATFGGYARGETELPNLSNAISSDGSRIFWTDTQSMKNGKPNPDMEHVYVLENGTTNVLVSGEQPAEFWAASADGRYAFYTEAGDLWRFDTHAVAPEDARIQLTKGAGVQGVIGTNQAGGEKEDGAYLYFVADGVLTNVPNSHGDHATPGECPQPGAGCNLYLLHEGVTSFLARLSETDNALRSSTVGFNQKGGDWQTGIGERVAQLTPDGRSLVFESVEPLTGYKAGFENAEPSVFVYSAGSAQLSCVSCSPTGAPAVQPTEEEVAEASKLPVSIEAKTYLRRWISENGARVFFDSSQPLVAQDKNGVQDVYEWERPAVPGETDNSCTAQNASPVTGGCTFLLSGGAGTNASFLVDADATGDNVFFEHVGRLGQLEAPVDHNELYDARVGGGFPQRALACTGAGCQGVPPAPPIFAIPSSVTFSGAGNPPRSTQKTAPRVRSLTRAQKLAKALKACARETNKHRRTACEAHARKRYGAEPRARKRQAGGRRVAKS